MSPEQIIILSVIQGISEFLPISSSGHLILVPFLTGWKDQGLTHDIMVHFGSLCALLLYFRHDIYRFIPAAKHIIQKKYINADGYLLLYIIVATIPVVIIGFFIASSDIGSNWRSGTIVGINSIIFGILLFLSDRFSKQSMPIKHFKISTAIIIGCFQVLALIPGVSRSGITITGARLLGADRVSAAHFSFLLAIPALLGASVLAFIDIIYSEPKELFIWTDAALAVITSFIASFCAIGFMMRFVRTIGLAPFAIYRILLGAAILLIF